MKHYSIMAARHPHVVDNARSWLASRAESVEEYTAVLECSPELILCYIDSLYDGGLTSYIFANTVGGWIREATRKVV